MPVLTDNMEEYEIPGATGNFKFSAIRADELGATEYTLVTLVTDITGSVSPFAHLLLECKKQIVRSCKKSPRADNLMLRDVAFNEEVYEVHGFKPLDLIDPDAYEPLDCDGMTALYDASYSAIGATLKYSENLINQDFDVNACVFIITDGDDNRSNCTPGMVADLMSDAVRGEKIESLVSILIGVNAKQLIRKLEKFKSEGNLTQFIDAGDATPGKLAKLAGFVSDSISSQSQSLGSGSASQPLNF